MSRLCRRGPVSLATAVGIPNHSSRGSASRAICSEIFRVILRVVSRVGTQRKTGQLQLAQRQHCAARCVARKRFTCVQHRAQQDQGTGYSPPMRTDNSFLARHEARTFSKSSREDTEEHSPLAWRSVAFWHKQGFC